MSEDDIVDILNLMFESIRMVQDRFSKIGMSEDFVSTPNGVTLLDAISMRLQVIGESVKKIQKTDLAFLNRYAEIEWDKIARFRDLVSHHYEHVDHEIVYDICRSHIPRLKGVIEKMIKGLPEMESLQEE
ncbi:MAG: HepT-like ribonuclease domain-containing protein [Thermodesulfobacteriota bacterium]|nr:HepT-like ribonuclease domain-containing protein [Thermodesulfobacteriota bacterium]